MTAPRAALAFAACLSALTPSSARAESTIKNPNPPKYSVEIGPKLNFGPDGVYAYGGTGFGPGVRFSIPLMSPASSRQSTTRSRSRSVWTWHYSGYRYYTGCGKGGCGEYDAGEFWAAYFPVTLQWNFWLTDRWSVFGEPGVAFRHSFYDDAYCNPNLYACGNRDDALFAFFIGGRFMLSDKVALTMRLGHPLLFSIGLSIFP